MKMINFIQNADELNKAKKMERYLGVTGDFILRALPHGNFYAYFSKGVSADEIERIEFERKLPKISKSILYSIIQYFRTDLTVEMVVRIFYNKPQNNFFVIYADGDKRRESIVYDFSKEKEVMMNPDNIMVMEIHSHNVFPAYFSEQDDRDEIYPGVFGVIGELDKQRVGMKFRAGMDGLFVELPWDELFQ